MLVSRRTVVLLACLLGLPFGAAEAGKRGSIIIPMPGSSGQIVKVVDLPDIAALRRPNGRYVDLGYRYTGNGVGEWIGYVGPRSYIPLSETQLQKILQLGGMSELPPLPARAAGPLGGVLWLLFAGGMLFWFVRYVKNGPSKGAGGRQEATDSGDSSSYPRSTWATNADAALSAARSSLTGTKDAAVAEVQSASSAKGIAGGMGFGRRA